MQTDYDNVNELYDLTTRCAEIAPDDPLLKKWTSRIQDSQVADLIALVARLATRDRHTSRELKALREAIIAEIGRKNSVMVVESSESLQNSANRLTKWSVIITVVGIFVGVVGVAVTVATLLT